MMNDMNTRLSGTSSLPPEPAAVAALPASECGKLPTLQRNALRKIFDRQEFSPEEVAGLGYRRLQLAEGIGRKGLGAIIAWLQNYGLTLKAVEINEPVPNRRPKKLTRNIEQAVRLLRLHGYEVLPKQRLGDGNN